MLSNRILVGKILKPRGLKGEVKVEVYTNDLDNFLKLRAVYIDDIRYYVEKAVTSDFVYMNLKGVDTVEKAEKLRGKDVVIDRADTSVPKGSYLICDLIGAKVYSDDILIGEVRSVLQYGAADIIEIKKADGGSASFPFLERLVKDIDVRGGIMKLDAKRLEEVLVDDNEI